ASCRRRRRRPSELNAVERRFPISRLRTLPFQRFFDQSFLAGRAQPGSARLHPSIGEAAAAGVGFATLRALLPITPSNNDRSLIGLRAHPFILNLVGMVLAGGDAGQKLLSVHK